jgi:hypothetical protein
MADESEPPAVFRPRAAPQWVEKTLTEEERLANWMWLSVGHRPASVNHLVGDGEPVDYRFRGPELGTQWFDLTTGRVWEWT